MPFQNPLIVALTTHDIFPNLDYTPYHFSVEGRDVVIHNNPEINSRQRNFSLWIDVDTQSRFSTDNRAAFAGDGYMRFLRMGKDTQSILLDKAMMDTGLVNNFTPIPTYAYSESGPKFNCPDFFDEVCSDADTMLVVKDCWGARGTGQMLLAPHFLSALVGFMWHSRAELQARVPSATITPTPDGEDSSPLFCSGRVVVQPLVKVAAEWRCIVVGGKLVAVFDRKRQELTAGYTQAGKDAAGAVTAKEVNVLTQLQPDLLKDIELLATKLNIGIGSIDLFEYEAGGYGIFEYSQEFGTVGYDPREVSSWCTDFVKHCLRVAGLIEKTERQSKDILHSPAGTKRAKPKTMS